MTYLTTIEESIHYLDKFAVEIHGRKEKYKVLIPSKILKNKLINIIKTYYTKGDI